MKIKSKLFFTAALLTLSASILAETAIVVHPSMRDTDVKKGDVAKIFLGKSNKLPSGNKVIPIDQDEDSQTRVIFYEEVTDKNPSQLTAYWARLIFSGKAQPPKSVLDDDEVMEMVANNPNIIGYVDKSYVNKSVKVILTIK